MRSQLSACAAALVIALSSVSHAQDLSLGQTVEGLLQFAIDRNPEYAGMRFEAAAATERINPAGALPDPKFRTEWRDITRGGDQRPNLLPGRVGSTRYLLMQDLPWAGKRELKREAAASLAEAARGRAISTWSELASKIKIAFAQLYYLEQNRRLNLEILDLLTRLETVAQSRYAGGLAAQQDVIRVQLEQTATRNELIGLDTERQQLNGKLNALLGRSAAELLAQPEQVRNLPAPEKSVYAALEERARTNNPVLKAEAFQIKAAEKNRELTYKNRYPDFTVGVSPIQYGGSFREWELMLEVNIPFQQDTRRSQERESEAMLDSARSRQEQVSKQILAELYENVTGLDASRRSLALISDSLLPQSELTFRSALAGYESGKVDFATLLDAQKQIRQAKLNQVNAALTAQMRLAEIERIIGEDL